MRTSAVLFPLTGLPPGSVETDCTTSPLPVRGFIRTTFAVESDTTSDLPSGEIAM